MLTGLLHTHSFLRYFVLLFLILVVITSVSGWLSKKPFTAAHNRYGLFLLITAHLQLVVGLLLYWKSDLVQFNAGTMSNAGLRHWTVEHITMMLLAITLITVARISSKKMADDTLRHKRLAIFNGIALLIILVTVALGGRGILHPSLF
jgi:hypothetical protein